MVLGVAGVGKTRFSAKLASSLGAEFIDVPELVKKKKIYSSYDEKSQAYLVDFRKVSAAVGAEFSGELGVVASIYPFKPRNAEVIYAIVLRMNPVKLVEVLKARGYPAEKIRENVSAELIDQPFSEAVERYGRDKVVQVDVTGRSLEDLAEEAAEKLKLGRLQELDQRIDWIGELERAGRLDELLRFLDYAGG